MMNKMLLLFCIVVALCMVADCNGADDLNPKTPSSAVVNSKKPIFPPQVSQVCKNTADPGICLFRIGTDPGAKNANLTKITIISIRTAAATAIDTIGTIRELKKDKSVEGDEAVMNCFKICSECYSDVVATFDDSLVEMMNKNYDAMKEKIKKAEVYEATCLKCFPTTKHKTARDAMYALNDSLAKLGKVTVSLVDTLQKAN